MRTRKGAHFFAVAEEEHRMRTTPQNLFIRSSVLTLPKERFIVYAARFGGAQNATPSPFPAAWKGSEICQNVAPVQSSTLMANIPPSLLVAHSRTRKGAHFSTVAEEERGVRTTPQNVFIRSSVLTLPKERFIVNAARFGGLRSKTLSPFPTA